MIMLSFSEENYLKAIYHLSVESGGSVSTNSIADNLDTKAASVSDMIRKLSEKGVVSYRKYHGVTVSDEGRQVALNVIRKHRLWETFLVEKLRFNWDEVHDVAEQLEHIHSPLLVKRLDEFLGYPKFDPHGDPIPDENGEFNCKSREPLSSVEVGTYGIIVAVNDSSAPFLQYVDKIGLYLGAKVKIVSKEEFDGSLELIIDNHQKIFVSKEVSENIWLTD